MSPTMRINLLSIPSKIILLPLLLIVTLLISGCATLNEGDCREGNWSGIGFNDAAAGLKSNVQLSSHIKACSRYKISSDNQAYHSGYANGLKQFCTREKGVRYGADSSEYYGVCPKHLERDFLTGYTAGLVLSMNELHDDIEELRYERRKQSRRLSALERAGRKDKKDKNHNGAIKKLRGRIDNIESSMSVKRSKLNKLRYWYSVWKPKISV